MEILVYEKNYVFIVLNRNGNTVRFKKYAKRAEIVALFDSIMLKLYEKRKQIRKNSL